MRELYSFVTIMGSQTGQCTVWKGQYGFIAPQDGSKDVYVHHSDIHLQDCLEPGDKVRFKIGPGPNGVKATNVVLVAPGDRVQVHSGLHVTVVAQDHLKPCAQLLLSPGLLSPTALQLKRKLRSFVRKQAKTPIE